MNESPSVVEADFATFIPWHSSAIDDLLQQLDSSVEGLDAVPAVIGQAAELYSGRPSLLAC